MSTLKQEVISETLGSYENPYFVAKPQTETVVETLKPQVDTKVVNRVRELEGNVKSLTDKLEKADKNITQLENRNKKLLEENDNLKVTISELEQQIKTLKSQAPRQRPFSGVKPITTEPTTTKPPPSKVPSKVPLSKVPSKVLSKVSSSVTTSKIEKERRSFNNPKIEDVREGKFCGLSLVGLENVTIALIKKLSGHELEVKLPTGDREDIIIDIDEYLTDFSTLNKKSFEKFRGGLRQYKYFTSATNAIPSDLPKILVDYILISMLLVALRLIADTQRGKEKGRKITTYPSIDSKDVDRDLVDRKVVKIIYYAMNDIPKLMVKQYLGRELDSFFYVKIDAIRTGDKISAIEVALFCRDTEDPKTYTQIAPSKIVTMTTTGKSEDVGDDDSDDMFKYALKEETTKSKRKTSPRKTSTGKTSTTESRKTLAEIRRQRLEKSGESETSIPKKETSIPKTTPLRGEGNRPMPTGSGSGEKSSSGTKTGVVSTKSKDLEDQLLVDQFLQK